MRERGLWSRREFVRVAGCSSLAAMSLPGWALGERARAARFAYVGSGEGIASFAVERRRWRRLGTVKSAAAVSLVMDARERFLYAVNEVDVHEDLPRGTVEAYAIDEASGGLRLMHREPLALSATGPRHAAVSPDGRALVVAVHGGGAYNVLPIGEDGRVGRVSGILKETGAGPHEAQGAAHPQMVVFDAAGRVVGADLGSDRLSVFALEEGGLRAAARCGVRAGSGPREVVMHPGGRMLFVGNGLDASVDCFAYDSRVGKVGARLGSVKTAEGEEQAVMMAMDARGEYLYAAHRLVDSRSEARVAGGVSVWRVEDSGAMRRVQVVDDDARLHAMTMVGGRLVGVSRESGSVLEWGLDGGRLERAVRVAELPEPVSVVVKTL